MEHEYELVSVDSIVLDPANARLHPEKNLEAIKGSLARFGQQKPILVCRANRIVIAGNGTLTAARELGWADIRVRWTDLSGPEATAYALADNRTSELAEWDFSVLGTQLKSLTDYGIEIGDFGFEANDFNLPEPDYGTMNSEPDPDFEGMRDGVKKAIQVEFNLEDYDEAFAIIKFWRERGAYVGEMIISLLKAEKEKL